MRNELALLAQMVLMEYRIARLEGYDDGYARERALVLHLNVIGGLEGKNDPFSFSEQERLGYQKMVEALIDRFVQLTPAPIAADKKPPPS
jgi:hypothetical protein